MYGGDTNAVPVSAGMAGVSGQYRSAATASTARQPMVPEAVQALNSQVINLHKAIDELQARMRPVLHNTPEQAAKNGNKPPSTPCELAAQIDDASYGINMAVEKIGALLGMLEV